MQCIGFNNEYETIARIFGYRILPDNKSMCKPYGFSMMKFNLETNTISRHFYGRGSVEDLLTWTGEVIEAADSQKFLEEVAAFEEYNSGMTAAIKISPLRQKNSIGTTNYET